MRLRRQWEAPLVALGVVVGHGVVGADGPTHHGVFDYAYLRMLPHMTIMAPADENELQHMVKTALSVDGPVAIRYPRGTAHHVTEHEVGAGLSARLVRAGDGSVAVLAIGTRVPTSWVIATTDGPRQASR